MPATIKEVALKAGVSIGTVSLVINNNKRISAVTRKKVLKAVKELDYHPSRSARGLVSNNTGNIGFILTDDHFLRTEPFYTRIFLGTEFAARDSNYYILLGAVSSGFKTGDKLPRFILERSVDGLIIAGKIPEPLLEALKQYKYPIVFADYLPPSGEYPVVLADNIKGGEIAAQHLIELGHRKIGFIGADISHPSISRRLYGFQEALQKSGLELNEKFIITGEEYPNRQCGHSAAEKMFSNIDKPTAIFACNDAMAIGAMHYLKANGYNIPDDVSIVGFDDVMPDYMVQPLLTTIRVPKIEMGIEAMNVIISEIKIRTPNKKILMPVELVVRESTQMIDQKIVRSI